MITKDDISLSGNCNMFLYTMVMIIDYNFTLISWDARQPITINLQNQERNVSILAAPNLFRGNGWWWPTRSNSSIVVVFSLFLWHLKILGKVFGREEAIGDRKIYMARAFGGYRRHNRFLYFSSVIQLNVLHNRLIHDIDVYIFNNH